MATDTTSGKIKTFCNRLRSYANDAGTTLNDDKVNVYDFFAPVDAPLPHVVVRLGPSATDPDVGDLREVFEVDAEIIGRARMDEPRVNAIADLITQALVSFRDPATADLGLLAVQSVGRGILDFIDSPTDDERIGLTVTAECFAWPALLTDALT